MNILSLIIKQKYFDEILAGKKKQEFREIRPTTAKKYVVYVCGDKTASSPDDLPGDKDIDVVPIRYDAIRFYVGYNTDRDSALVEVKDAAIEFFADEDGNDIVYEYKGEEYIAAQVVYDLGAILEKHINP